MENKELLPLGSLVYLKEGTKKMMIIGRGVMYQDETTQNEQFVDYLGCGYPEGVDPKQTFFFNREDIDRVIFKGFSDEDEVRFNQVYQDWEKEISLED